MFVFKNILVVRFVLLPDNYYCCELICTVPERLDPSGMPSRSTLSLSSPANFKLLLFFQLVVNCFIWYYFLFSGILCAQFN